MGRFYGERILAGIITIDDVPRFWRRKVEDWLAENGGNI